MHKNIAGSTLIKYLHLLQHQAKAASTQWSATSLKRITYAKIGNTSVVNIKLDARRTKYYREKREKHFKRYDLIIFNLHKSLIRIRKTLWKKSLGKPKRINFIIFCSLQSPLHQEYASMFIIVNQTSQH